MHGTRRGLALALTGLTLAAPLGAQVTLNPGAKVRLDAPSAGVKDFKGTVIAAGDTIDVARGDARLRVPAAAITRLEVSRGKSRLAGAGRGALWGGGVGLAYGLATLSLRDQVDGFGTDCDEDPLFECETIGVGPWLAATTVGGAAWGVLIGAIIGREEWDTIAVPGTRTSMTVRPVMTPGGRVGLVATLR